MAGSDDTETLPGFNRNWALFLDVDGTLLELASDPENVQVSDELLAVLEGLSVHINGAMALISGRPISKLDELFSPYKFCAAGLHGLERRDTEGSYHYHDMPAEAIGLARMKLSSFAARHSGIILEDKKYSIAMHYRQAPELADSVRELMDECMQDLEDDFHLQRGKMVYEIKPRGKDKGTAIDEYMREVPFLGRLPVFIGDDITDEDGFITVNKLKGKSIKVGSGNTAAAYRMKDAATVKEWLIAYNAYLDR